MRRYWIITVCLAALCGTSSAAADDWRATLKEKKLLLNFSGKGSSLPYDAGVSKRAYETIPSLGDAQFIVAGNSSGSIMAAYFSCFGFSKTSVDYAEYRMIHADVSAIRSNENGLTKMGKLAQHKQTEISLENLREYIGFALGVNDWKAAGSIAEIVRRSPCRPVYPIVIAAANAEVLENRTNDFMIGKNEKTFDGSTYAVSWKPDVYEFYREHAAMFERDHPELRLGDTPYIGQACTLFCDRTMFELLRRIPASERQCDLRLMTTAEDLALAIQASVAEPSYFPRVPEMDYSKLLIGDEQGKYGNCKRRSYCGGFVMPLMAQDIRRTLPSLRVMGSGWTYVPMMARRMVQSWYLVDIRPAVQHNLWWADLEVTAPKQDENAMINRIWTARQEFDAGYRNASRTLDAGRGLPEYVEPPKFGSVAKAALYPPLPGIDVDVDAKRSNGADPPLKTLRGLGPLVKTQTAAR